MVSYAVHTEVDFSYFILLLSLIGPNWPLLRSERSNETRYIMIYKLRPATLNFYNFMWPKEVVIFGRKLWNYVDFLVEKWEYFYFITWSLMMISSYQGIGFTFSLTIKSCFHQKIKRVSNFANHNWLFNNLISTNQTSDSFFFTYKPLNRIYLFWFRVGTLEINICIGFFKLRK